MKLLIRKHFFRFICSYGLSYEEIEKGLPMIDTSKTLIREVCPPFLSGVECRPGKYRRFDGLCNNLEHPTWGAANTPFQRIVGPLFSDGINSPRISVTGKELPLSRIVSRTIHPDEGYHDHAGTVMVIAWGQFMDHDFTLTGTPLGKAYIVCLMQSYNSCFFQTPSTATTPKSVATDRSTSSILTVTRSAFPTTITSTTSSTSSALTLCAPSPHPVLAAV
jgi:Animal haem peroxidase